MDILALTFPSITLMLLLHMALTPFLLYPFPSILGKALTLPTLPLHSCGCTYPEGVKTIQLCWLISLWIYHKPPVDLSADWQSYCTSPAQQSSPYSVWTLRSTQRPTRGMRANPVKKVSTFAFPIAICPFSQNWLAWELFCRFPFPSSSFTIAPMPFSQGREMWKHLGCQTKVQFGVFEILFLEVNDFNDWVMNPLAIQVVSNSLLSTELKENIIELATWISWKILLMMAHYVIFGI